MLQSLYYQFSSHKIISIKIIIMQVNGNPLGELLYHTETLYVYKLSSHVKYGFRYA